MNMQIKCNAKINIGLEILNKRTDDYHNINTIFHKICLTDELVIENSEKFQFIFHSDLDLPDEKNLAFRAAELFKKVYELSELPVKITIKKNIPDGAGLGGGSSDAGNVLKGLSEFLNLHEKNDEIVNKSVELGADVPFFLLDQTSAIARGRGEILNGFSLHLPYYILLVMPGIQVSTADAYRGLERDTNERESTDYANEIDIFTMAPQRIKEIFHNDFETVIFKQYPLLKEIKEQLYNSGAIYAQMSGTGSTLYGFFKELEKINKFVEKFGSYRTKICLPG